MANSPIQGTLIRLTEHIAVALGAEFKVYLPKLMPQILRVLNHDTSKDRRVTKDLLEALRKFGNNLDDYMHLILPPIVKLFDDPNCPTAVSRQALETIDQLAEILDFSDFISRIVHPLARTLDTNPELRATAMDTLCSLVAQLGRKFIMFIPLVSRITTKHKISCARYEVLVSKIAAKSTLADEVDFPMVVPPRARKVNREPTLPSGDTTMVQRLKVRVFHG